MSELKNTFSWSVSAMQDFEVCHRRRYWSKYAMWGGWKADADEIRLAAYRLSKMENRFSLLGNAVEQSVIWALRRLQRGDPVAADLAYDEAAKPFLNRRWIESRKRMWEANPKKFCCLHEHYYPEHHDTPEKEMVARMADRLKFCISNFIARVAPALKNVAAANEIAIATVERGDPESMDLEGVKVYAIPDYAYRLDDQIHIHDWKSGKPKSFHKEQMALYGLWAVIKHGGGPGSVHAHLEYLSLGDTQSATLSDADVQYVRALIARSSGDMAEYLADCDIAKNVPLPKDEWELTADHDACRRCNFYELCKPEL